jgi:hypothetical protein
VQQRRRFHPAHVPLRRGAFASRAAEGEGRDKQEQGRNGSPRHVVSFRQGRIRDMNPSPGAYTSYRRRHCRTLTVSFLRLQIHQARLPGHRDRGLHASGCGTCPLMHGESPLRRAAPHRVDGKRVAGVYRGQPHPAVLQGDPPCDDRLQPGRGDVTRLQRALQRAGQSAGERQHQLVERPHVDLSRREVRRDRLGR